MKPQKQLFRHKPDEKTYGDCHRTCLASLFDLDAVDVPHFLDGFPEAPEFNRRVDDWVKSIGYREFRMVFKCDTVQEVLDTMGILNPGVYYLLGGTSKNQVGHSVICLDNAIAWDPALDDSGIVAPLDDFYWVSVFVQRRFVCD